MTTVDPADPADLFGRWLVDQGEQVFLAMADDLAAQLPELATEADLPALRGAVTSHRASMGAEVRGRSAPFSLPAPAQAYARMLAVRGTPLATLLRSYEIGHTVIWRTFTAHLRAEFPPEAQAERAEALELASVRLFEYLQAATAESVSIYNDVTSRRALGESMRKAELVRRVLRSPGGEAEVEEAIGYRFAATHVGFVAATADDERADAVEGTLETLLRPRGWVRMYVAAGPRSVHGWVASSAPDAHRRLAALPLPGWLTLAVGSPAPGTDGFRATHRQALEAQRIAERTGADGATLFADVAAAALASRDLDLARAFVEQELRGLLGPGDVRLLETLRELLRQAGSVTATAHRLHLHPNTVRQRLQRIESALGRPVEAGSTNLRLAIELELARVRES